jgi:hypothetical protein
LYSINDSDSIHALVESDLETPSQVSFMIEVVEQQPSKRLVGHWRPQ